MTFEENDANRSMIENVEGRLLDVQSKLKALQEEKNKPSAGFSAATSPTTSHRAPFRGGRGRHEVLARGRGRGRAGRATNMSLDTRPKTLIITKPPEGFETQIAQQHFARYTIYALFTSLEIIRYSGLDGL